MEKLKNFWRSGLISSKKYVIKIANALNVFTFDFLVKLPLSTTLYKANQYWFGYKGIDLQNPTI
jgi:hypothetical protein